MILRFRGKDGSYRVRTSADALLSSVLTDLEKQLPPHDGSVALSSHPAAQGEEFNEKWQLPVAQLGLKHGDMLYISYISSAVPVDATSISSEKGSDALDHELSVKDGRIARAQTSLCTHGAKGMCEYCQPLEPWDEEYQQSKGIKHVSIHAWSRKVKEEGGFLEEPDYQVKKDCNNGHPPWPEGFCSKCQPPAITLQRQKFRMVDHVEFVSPKIIEQFIEFWRQTNNQRIGFLIGKYAPYDDSVPLGIKAEVHAIWEPQQLNDVDSLLMQELPGENVIKASRLLGMSVVGVIFTDLVDQGAGNGKVVTKRHLKSYFLSSLEVFLAARLQNQYPHSLPSVGKFSSRFVTCCVSGNEFGDIDVACYQVSTQAEAMAKADLIVPSTNPSVMRIQPPTEQRYVPDIFYKRINEYKLTVQENAKPAFPLEYLLVSLSHGFNTQEIPESFTIENRPQLRCQTPAQLADALGLPHGMSVKRLAEFHLLAYYLDLGVLQKDEEALLTSFLRMHINKQGTDEQIADLALTLASGPGANTIRMLA